MIRILYKIINQLNILIHQRFVKYLESLTTKRSPDYNMGKSIRNNMNTMPSPSKMLILGLADAIQNGDLSFEARNANFTHRGFMGFYSISYKVNNLQMIIERDCPKQYDQRNSVKIMAYNEDLKMVEDFSEYFTEDLQRIIQRIIESAVANRKEQEEKSKTAFLSYKKENS